MAAAFYFKELSTCDELSRRTSTAEFCNAFRHRNMEEDSLLLLFVLPTVWVVDPL